MAAEERGSAGWYADPEQAGTVRYWDGASWTEQRAPAIPTSGSSAGIGVRVVLGGAGAVAIIVGVFLPMLDPGSSLPIVHNSVIMHYPVAAVLALIAAIAAAVKAGEGRKAPGIDWSLTIVGGLAIGGAIYAGTGDRTHLRLSISALGETAIEAQPGIGLYALCAGGVLIALAGFVGGASKSAMSR